MAPGAVRRGARPGILVLRSSVRQPGSPSWRPGQPGTAQERRKCIWGSQTTRKRRTRMKKSDLGDLGAPRRSKVLKTQLCDSDLPEQQNTSYTYAKTQKCLFVTFYFLEIPKKSSLFRTLVREGKLLIEKSQISCPNENLAPFYPFLHFCAPT